MAKEIPLTRGKVAIVDDEDFEWLNQWKWYYDSTGYAVRGVWDKEVNKQRKVRMHRVILGVTDPKIHVDHADGNPLNNTRGNLRVCTHQQNHMNERKRKNCCSQYKGVCFDKRAGKWRAYIKKDGKQIHLGLYVDEKEAARAYNDAAFFLFGEFACLNQIEEEC